MNTCDVAILGAGIIGAACARALTLAGLRVVVIERGAIACGTTAAGMGHVTVMNDSDAQFALTDYSQTLWNDLAPQLPADVEYVKAGTLWLAVDDDEMTAVQQKHVYYQARGVASEVLDGRAVAAAEPNLRSGLAGGLRVPGDSVIDPPSAARWMIEEARGRGAEIRLGSDVSSISDKTIVLSDGSRLACGNIVHATGVWAGTLVPGLPIRPRKGHLALTARQPGYITHQLVELGYMLKSAHGSERDSVAFNLQPRKFGELLIGSSRQFDVTAMDIEPAMLQRMMTRAFEYMPGLSGLNTVRTWTGIRAATPDSLPLIGPTAIAGHLLATGHEGLGITTALGTAELIVSHVTGKPSAIGLTPYLPSRFVGAAQTS